MSPGQSQNAPLGEAEASSNRSSASNASIRSPKSDGAAPGHPSDVGHPSADGVAGRLGQHLRLRVEPDDLGRVGGEVDGDGLRPAPDIEDAAALDPALPTRNSGSATAYGGRPRR